MASLCNSPEAVPIVNASRCIKMNVTTNSFFVNKTARVVGDTDINDDSISVIELGRVAFLFFNSYLLVSMRIDNDAKIQNRMKPALYEIIIKVTYYT